MGGWRQTGKSTVGEVHPGDNSFCGGMAEWSMAVVLKTSPIGYSKTVIFLAEVPHHMRKDVATLWAFCSILQLPLITDRQEFRCKSLT